MRYRKREAAPRNLPTASLVRPSLSTVRVPLAEVGAAAINALETDVVDPSQDGG